MRICMEKTGMNANVRNVKVVLRLQKIVIWIALNSQSFTKNVFRRRRCGNKMVNLAGVKDCDKDGHCGNVPPMEQVTSKEYKRKLKELTCSMSLRELIEWDKSKTLSIDEFDDKSVDCYHIDTQLGLCRFADMIIENKIVTEFVND